VTSTSSRPALRLAAAAGVDLAEAIDAFLSQPDLAPTTRAKYRQTLAGVEDELGDAPVTGTGLAGVRPTIGATPASVESVRLDPELRRQLLERAQSEGTTPSELIREALRRFLRAT
jgi:Ribbon-helix-helix protein, copG family